MTDVATPEPQASSGEVARTALADLAKQDETQELVERAIATRPRPEKFDPATLVVGALVLMAFHAEIKLERDPAKGWSFRFHAQQLKDSTIGKLLGQLMGVHQTPTP